MKILVTTLTTGQRNQTFMKCLESLQLLSVTDDDEIQILVVENNVEFDPSVSAIISSFQNQEKPVLHILEKKAGIPNARNAALTYAQEHQFTHLAFIDDDAFADTEWIKELTFLIKGRQIASGPQLAIFPEETSDFYRNAVIYHERKITNGQEIKWAATNNILIDVGYMAQQHLAFNGELIHGGEDKELFLQVNKRQGKLIWCSNAIVSEYIDENRLSISWAMRRTFRIGATGFLIESSVKTPVKTYLTCIFKGVIYLLKGLILLPYQAIHSKGSVLNSFCDIAHGAGFFFGLMSKGRVRRYT